MTRKQILQLGNKICFCERSKTFLHPGHNVAFERYVSSLATMKTMLTRFQCCSLQMFPSNGKQTQMADGEVEVEEKGKKERNWKNEERERELLIALYDCSEM